MATVTTPYSSAMQLVDTLPAWVTDTYDQQRIAAYQLYYDMYWNTPETYKKLSRGEDTTLYIPTGRKLIEAVMRYFARDFSVNTTNADDSAPAGTEALLAARAFLNALFIREEFFTKLTGLKRSFLMRGDALWHLTADPTKEAGKRLSLKELSAETYFPIYDTFDVDRVVGCYIVDLYDTPDGKSIARRLEYHKIPPISAGGTPTITVRLGWFESDGWDDRDGTTALKPAVPPTDWVDSPSAQALMAGFVLPPQIQSIPVYHYRNSREGANPYGSAELRGFEAVLSGIVDTVTDEDLALALQGLGVYMTDSPPPTDPDTGSELDWQIAPGYVVQLQQGYDMKRLEGINSVTPFQDHLGYLGKELKETSGTPDIAVGSVDVQVASSGIALALQMGPLLQKNAEKVDELIAKSDQMLYDILTMWAPAYEALNFPGVKAACAVGDPLPVDRAARIAEIQQIMGMPGVASAEWARAELVKLGFDFAEDIGTQIYNEQLNAARIADPFGARLAEEVQLTSDTVTSGPAGTGGASATGPNVVTNSSPAAGAAALPA
jgi:hypothetical protein